MRRLVLMLLLAVVVYAKDKPPEPQLTELQKKDLIIAFQTALLRQAALAVPQYQFQQAAQAYEDLRLHLAKDAGFPTGTSVTVDRTTLEVIVVPPSPPAPKPETKPDSPK